MKYVRHKTGAGSNIVYEPNNAEDAEDATITEDAADEEVEEGAGGFLELASFSRHATPTIDEDKTELVASASTTNADNTALNADENQIREERDHNVKVAHKIRGPTHSSVMSVLSCFLGPPSVTTGSFLCLQTFFPTTAPITAWMP